MNYDYNCFLFNFIDLNYLQQYLRISGNRIKTSFKDVNLDFQTQVFLAVGLNIRKKSKCHILFKKEIKHNIVFVPCFIYSFRSKRIVASLAINRTPTQRQCFAKKPAKRRKSYRFYLNWSQRYIHNIGMKEAYGFNLRYYLFTRKASRWFSQRH